MKDNLTTTANKQLHPRRPIKYWIAHEQGQRLILDWHESIAILRARNSPDLIFKAIR